MQAYDSKGIKLKPGQVVYSDHHAGLGIGHQGIVKVITERPTSLRKGYWVDVDFGSVVEPMMSYMLQVISEGWLPDQLDVSKG